MRLNGETGKTLLQRLKGRTCGGFIGSGNLQPCLCTLGSGRPVRAKMLETWALYLKHKDLRDYSLCD